MTAVRLRIAAEIRTRWAAWLGVALVLGLGGGVVLTALAAAHRGDQAYVRFGESQDAADTLVVGRSAFFFVGNVDTAKVAHLPAVARSARASVVLLFSGRTDGGRPLGPADVFPVVSTDGALGSSIERWHILAGRRADPRRVDEVTVSFLAAERLGLHVGSRLRFRFVESNQFAAVAVGLLNGLRPRLTSATIPPPVIDQQVGGEAITFRVVGIEASPAEFPPLGDNIAPPIHLTPAFATRYADDLVESPLLYVRLRRGAAGLTAFESKVEALGNGAQTSFVFTKPRLTDAVQQATRTEGLAARALAALVGVALLAVVTQFLARLGGRDDRDRRTLHAVGMTDAQIVGVAGVRGALVGVVGAAIAVGVAWGLSPLTPVGLARKADLHTGLRFDGTTFGLGALAVIGGCVLVGVLGAAWATRRAVVARRGGGERTRVPYLVRAARAWGAPTTMRMGAWFAVAPSRSSRSVPLRTAAAGVGLAVAILVGTATFVGNLNRLLDTPSRYGWTWDVEAGAPGLPGVVAAPLSDALSADEEVSDYAGGTVSQLFLESSAGRVVRSDVLALRQHRGLVVPTLLEGRMPSGSNEIALGSRTLDALGLRVGDQVTTRVADRRVRMTIVARAIVPGLGEAGVSGSRAFLSFSAFARLLPEAEENVFLIHFEDGVDRARAFEHMKAALDPLPTQQAVRPTNLSTLARIRSVPAVLVGLLAGIALVTLIGTLVSSIRRRRQEVSLLRALGLRHGQIREALLWEASAIVLAAVVVGGPIGAWLGRAAWRAFAQNSGLATDAAWPGPLVLVGALGLLVVADLVVVVAARSLARQHPADALRDP